MSDAAEELPAGLILDRVTREFSEDSVPRGLLSAHRVADGVWGRLVVRKGELTFVFEDDPDPARVVAAGESIVIPPGRFHHLEFTSRAKFVVEFHRQPLDT